MILGCAKNNPIPDNILDKDKMVKILVDIHLCEAKCGQSFLRGDTAKTLYARMENELFIKYKISKQSYLNSYQYYMNNLSEFDDIYARVVDSLSLREQLNKL